MTSSELTAVNFPSFHVTPLKLMVSPTSVAAVPVGNSPALASNHPLPVQNPSSAIVNFTLQHLGLISPSVQVSANPGPGTIPVSPRIEAVSIIPENAGTQQGRANNYDSPVLGQSHLNGQSVAVIGTQQVSFSSHTIFPSMITSEVSVSWKLSCFLALEREKGVKCSPSFQNPGRIPSKSIILEYMRLFFVFTKVVRM